MIVFFIYFQHLVASQMRMRFIKSFCDSDGLCDVQWFHWDSYIRVVLSFGTPVSLLTDHLPDLVRQPSVVSMPPLKRGRMHTCSRVVEPRFTPVARGWLVQELWVMQHSDAPRDLWRKSAQLFVEGWAMLSETVAAFLIADLAVRRSQKSVAALVRNGPGWSAGRCEIVIPVKQLALIHCLWIFLCCFIMNVLVAAITTVTTVATITTIAAKRINYVYILLLWTLCEDLQMG